MPLIGNSLAYVSALLLHADVKLTEPPKQFSALIASHLAKFAKIIKEAEIKAD
jgi:hypothetical protein